MIRLSVPALCVLLAAPGASAQGTFVPPPDFAAARGPLTPLQADMARQLRRHGLGDVDVRALSGGQLAALNHVFHSDLSSGAVRAQARSVVGRGVFSRFLNR